MMDNSVSPSGTTSPSSLYKRASRALTATAFLAVLAASLLFLLPGGPLHAQDADGPIMYAENGTGPVATYTAVDPEMTAVKWTLSGVDAGDFSIDGGVLTFKKSPDYEAATGGGSADTDVSNTYSVMVVATDATRRVGTKVITVNVTNVDEQGTVKLTTLRPRAGVELMASVTDPDGSDTGHVWQWAKSRSGTSGWADIDKAMASKYTPADDDADYYLRATVTYKDRESVRDTKTAEAVSANTVKAARSQNEAPKFPDQDLETDGDQSDAATRKVAENTAAGEAIGDPVVATDGDGDILTYTLVAASSPNADDVNSFAIDRATGQLMTKGKLDFEDDTNTDDEYVVVVRATDPDGMPEAETMDEEDSAEITVTIMVTEVNEAPDITGMDAVSLEENGTITVHSYTAVDPESETPEPTLALAGADRGKFDFDITNGDLGFKAEPDYEKPGDANKDNVYEVTVEATDAVGNTGTKDVKVTVTNLDEDGTVTMSQRQPRVGVPITASVTDPDGDVSNVTWQWSRSTTENGNFDNIAKATSATYKPAMADFDPRMFLQATAKYTDGEGETKTAMGTSENLVDEDTRNRPPAFDDQDDDTMGVQNDETTREVAENTVAPGGVGSAVTATDPAPNSDELDYTLSGADADSFTINSDGQIQVGAGTKLDFETKTTYVVTVKAEDSFGESDTIMVTIMVTPVDEMPEIMGEATAEYAENGAGPVATYTATDPEMTAVKWTLSGVDAGDFSIDGGVLTFKKSPDYEAATGGGSADTDVSNTYSVMVVATDATRRVGTKVITVNVTNVDEQGTVKLTTLRPRAGVAVTASVSDPDGNETGAEWQWAKSQNRTRGWADIDKATASMYTPGDDDVGYYLRATVTYKDKESVRDTKTAEVVSANTVKAVLAKNEAPKFPDQDLEMDGDQSDAATRKVAENTAAGEAIGDPVVATDGDGDILTYTLVAASSPNADDVNSFAIDRATGQLMTKGKLDFEDDTNTGNEYVVVVRATDPVGMPEAETMDEEDSAEITVTIMVTGVDEAPDITGMDAVSFEEGGDIATALDTYTADDPEENDAPTLALAGADRGKFDFDITNGDLGFKVEPDYEKPGDANKDNVYEVTVEATDAVGNTGTKDVKVTVTNVEEAGTVTMSQRRPRVGVPITASVTDPDGDVSNVTWQWYDAEAIPENLDDNAFAKATSATYKPVADDVGDALWARATYTDGQGEAKTAMGQSANVVAVDTRNKPPAFDDQDEDTTGVQNDETTREVAEDTEASGNVGSPVTATDPAPNSDDLDYTLEGDDADSFTITSAGQIQVGAGRSWTTKRRPPTWSRSRPRTRSARATPSW